ncbi:MAG: PTS glucose transporter subunit IIA [Mycoplasmataceae bacterium]|jgi:glucose-specific phosphotransferase system IIA component|nr:PTS glucose transporter subunit IIA [Mycoplasmataceae bacterium]
MGFLSKLFKRKNGIGGGSSAKELDICSPVDGEIISTSKVKDETFSKNMIGKGFAVIPSNGEFVAPIDGELSLVAQTGHAFSIKSQNGIEILVHIGIDTVSLNSDHKPNTPLHGFKLCAKTGDVVKLGTPVITADLAFIQSKKLDIVTPVIVVNNNESASKTVSDILVSGKVTKGTKIIQVK